MDIIANKIKELEIKVGLELAGFTMADIARALGCSKTHIANVIQQKTKSKRVNELLQKNTKKVKITILDQ